MTHTSIAKVDKTLLRCIEKILTKTIADYSMISTLGAIKNPEEFLDVLQGDVDSIAMQIYRIGIRCVDP
jgi:hypothetical protein